MKGMHTNSLILTFSFNSGYQKSFYLTVSKLSDFNKIGLIFFLKFLIWCTSFLQLIQYKLHGFCNFPAPHCIQWQLNSKAIIQFHNQNFQVPWVPLKKIATVSLISIEIWLLLFFFFCILSYPLYFTVEQWHGEICRKFMLRNTFYIRCPKKSYSLKWSKKCTKKGRWPSRELKIWYRVNILKCGKVKAKSSFTIVDTE